MTLKLSSLTTVVISSLDVAKEGFHKHDQSMSSRTIPSIARVNDHHKNSILWLPVFAHRKNLRKVCATHLFTPHQLDANQSLRQKKVQKITRLCV